MSLVGANNFAILWEGGPAAFKHEIWLPTFHKVVQKYKSSDINIMFMGADVHGYTNLGYFSKFTFSPKIKMY